ncbi:MAG: hypothetical protein HOP08_11105 [Cyclobacteriaceae bacterium]|nr:hypothetical protein [Cyclobacteriaceae bacterium]
MKSFLNAYRFLNIISIDVACGAVVCAAFFADILMIKLKTYGFASLGMTVWIIYTIDHLLDAGRLKNQASTERHRFHQKYYKLLSRIVILAIFIDLYMIFHVRKAIFDKGLALSFVVLIYLLLQKWISPFKEVVAALLYTCGIVLPAFSLYSGILPVSSILLMISFAITAFINLILFSMFDVDKDISHTQSSIVILIGKRNTSFFLMFLFFAQGILFFYLAMKGNNFMEIIVLLVMNVVLIILFVFSEQFKGGDRYRLIGDAIFLLPLPYLILNG